LTEDVVAALTEETLRDRTGWFLDCAETLAIRLLRSTTKNVIGYCWTSSKDVCFWGFNILCEDVGRTIVAGAASKKADFFFGR
jgi:hypothetical protein